MTTATVLTVPPPPQSRLARFGARATQILEYAAAIGIGIMLLIVLANIISRYFFGLPIQGTNEYVGNIWLPIVAGMGFIVSVARRQSIEADIIYGFFPLHLKREVRFFTSLCAAVCSGLFCYFGFQEAVHAMDIAKTAPASDIYIAPVYWIVPIAFFFLVVMFALDAVRAIRGTFDDENLMEFEALEIERETTP